MLIHALFDSVISGGQGMVFRWNDDKLYTQRGEEESANDDWTTFCLDMREPEDVNIYSLIKIIVYTHFINPVRIN